MLSASSELMKTAFNETEVAGNRLDRFVLHLRTLASCEISGSHGGEHEDGPLGYSAVLSRLGTSTFQRSVLPPPSKRRLLLIIVSCDPICDYQFK
jgi:hypothetical protein